MIISLPLNQDKLQKLQHAFLYFQIHNNINLIGFIYLSKSFDTSMYNEALYTHWLYHNHILFDHKMNKTRMCVFLDFTHNVYSFCYECPPFVSGLCTTCYLHPFLIFSGRPISSALHIPWIIKISIHHLRLNVCFIGSKGPYYNLDKRCSNHGILKY